jgi:coniferyl-aldehyde dehydrogenase
MATAHATKPCLPKSSASSTVWTTPQAPQDLDEAQRRGVDMEEFLRRNQPRHSPASGHGGRHRAVELSDLDLSFNGLIAAFAAGNRSMVKMSENSRHLAKLLIEKSPDYFPRDKLAFFDETGGVGM